ncbi:hypothetical protein [Burkholderia sp. MSMB1589WGS]|uniref:hypothetical protein n=1 Tax=Burkholderia sp. MSMB1589WGS TaxID=1636425 RepID=UPI0007BA4091|nr:hypothetical protein [Burkholderia sp. MSMB1589WGS]
MKAAKAASGPVLQSSFIKLLLVPLLTLWIGVSLGIKGPALTIIVLFNSLPCTPSAYIMAKLLGKDHRRAADRRPPRVRPLRLAQTIWNPIIFFRLRVEPQTIAHALTHIKQASWIPPTQLSRNRP